MFLNINNYEMLQVLLITIILVAAAFAGFAVKMIFQKNGEFKKSCGSVDPATGQPIGCSCGKTDGGASCDNKNRYRFQTVDIKE